MNFNKYHNIRLKYIKLTYMFKIKIVNCFYFNIYLMNTFLLIYFLSF